MSALLDHLGLGLQKRAIHVQFSNPILNANVGGISKKYHTTVKELAKINSLHGKKFII